MVAVGDRFGLWTVVGAAEVRHGHRHWLCHCRCGAERVVQQSKLTSDRWSSCGCILVRHGRQRKRVDGLTEGQVLGRLTLVARLVIRAKSHWQCRCACGREVLATAAQLKMLDKTHCGCLGGEIGAPRILNIWRLMIKRCYDPRVPGYANYGGRGITVCDEWRASFNRFLADVGPRPTARHSIDRIDNSRGYSPGNVRWATRRQQARNTRKNHLIKSAGETLCVADWAERLGCHSTVIHQRLRAGWPAEAAVVTPLRPYRRLVGQPSAAEAN